MQAGPNATGKISITNGFSEGFVATWWFQVVDTEELSNVFLVNFPISQKEFTVFAPKA